MRRIVPAIIVLWVTIFLAGTVKELEDGIDIPGWALIRAEQQGQCEGHPLRVVPRMKEQLEVK